MVVVETDVVVAGVVVAPPAAGVLVAAAVLMTKTEKMRKINEITVKTLNITVRCDLEKIR